MIHVRTGVLSALAVAVLAVGAFALDGTATADGTPATSTGEAGGALGLLARESGLQITPDELRTLISKDVEDERWAITRNADDGSVTGNVFFPTGGDPLFVFCEQTSIGDDEVSFDCYGADACPGEPCGGDQFSFLAPVTLPTAFFLPEEPEVIEAALGAALADAATKRPEAPAGVALRESGLQITPDGKRTLISKDVEDERWAITRNADDLTVTGNVFFPTGGPPLFVYCEQTGVSGEDVSLDCYGADACPAAPCPGDQFSFLAPVTLPESFFLPESDGPSPTLTPSPTATPVPTLVPSPTDTPTVTATPGDGPVCGNGIVEGDEECDGADLDGEDCELLVGGIEGCTGTLGCNPDCTFDASACSCPCEGDFDCDYRIDCTSVVEDCELFGACDGSVCITTPQGSSEVCNGLDPEDPDPDFPRCE